MGEHIDLRFRPSLLIFVGEAGKSIREQLSPKGLLVHLDEPLRQCVALLQVEADHSDVAEVFPIDHSLLSSDPDIPRGSGPLEEMVEQALISVQLNRRRQFLESAGYPVPNPRTQILIIGELIEEEDDDEDEERREKVEKHAAALAKILRTVQGIVRRNRFQTPVCYILNSYTGKNEDYAYTLKRPIEASIANNKRMRRDHPARFLEWSDYEIANYIYLFEHMISYPFPVFMTKSEVQYATAEALFALISTGISPSTLFEKEMQLPAMFESYAGLVGNLNTSMVMFPRPAATSYCSARLSSELIQQWYDTLDASGLSEGEQQALRVRARNSVQRIADWIRETVERPYTTEYLWPSLGILRQHQASVSKPSLYKQADIHRALVEQMGELVRTFDSQQVTGEYERQKIKVQTWADIAYKRISSAAGSYISWETTAKQAWETARERAYDEIRQVVEALWPEGDKGFQNAHVYAICVVDQLRHLEEAVDKWRKQYEDRYRNDINDFAALAEEKGAPWLLSGNAPNIRGASIPHTMQAKPTMGGQGPVLFARPGGGMTAGSASFVGSSSLPPREDGIGNNLRRRAMWKESLVPSAPLLAGTGFLSWLTATLAPQLLGIPLQGLPAIAFNTAFAIVFAVLGLSLRRQRQRQLDTARQDAMEFYLRCYIYKCELRENTQRIDLVHTLVKRMDHIRSRLEHIYSSLKNMQTKAQGESQTVATNLFLGPSSQRDIFIANGERLQPQGKNTLESVSNTITQMRQNRPSKHWHSSFKEMKDELVRMFRNLQQSLLEMTEEQTLDQIYDFSAQIVEEYLKGSLVNIATALDKKDIWEEVLDRVRMPLYYSTGTVREPLYVFVCGSDQDLRKGHQFRRIPTDPNTITVQTKNLEWLLVAGFFRGGEAGTIDTRGLFPPKVVAKFAPPPSPDGASASVGTDARNPVAETTMPVVDDEDDVPVLPPEPTAPLHAKSTSSTEKIASPEEEDMFQTMPLNGSPVAKTEEDTFQTMPLNGTPAAKTAGDDDDTQTLTRPRGGKPAAKDKQDMFGPGSTTRLASLPQSKTQISALPGNSQDDTDPDLRRRKDKLSGPDNNSNTEDYSEPDAPRMIW